MVQELPDDKWRMKFSERITEIIYHHIDIKKCVNFLNGVASIDITADWVTRKSTFAMRTKYAMSIIQIYEPFSLLMGIRL